jgi:hypothetical protein
MCTRCCSTLPTALAFLFRILTNLDDQAEIRLMASWYFPFREIDPIGRRSILSVASSSQRLSAVDDIVASDDDSTEDGVQMGAVAF